ncbi:hypothetical protein MMC06_001007 [Schaereria dolodes]|nr:hypothetical protein [Schaereria dolodes]
MATPHLLALPLDLLLRVISFICGFDIARLMQVSKGLLGFIRNLSTNIASINFPLEHKMFKASPLQLIDANPWNRLHPDLLLKLSIAVIMANNKIATKIHKSRRNALPIRTDDHAVWTSSQVSLLEDQYLKISERGFDYMLFLTRLSRRLRYTATSLGQPGALVPKQTAVNVMLGLTTIWRQGLEVYAREHQYLLPFGKFRVPRFELVYADSLNGTYLTTLSSKELSLYRKLLEGMMRIDLLRTRQGAKQGPYSLIEFAREFHCTY